MITKQEFVKTVQEMAGSVWDFHDRFNIRGIDSLSTGKDVYEIMSKRALLQSEEVGELCRALNKGLLDEIYLEAADVLYIALGTILSASNFGVDACWQIIGKNNEKTHENYWYSSVGKIVKR